MTRQHLISALRNVAGKLGYSFHTGFDYRINTGIKKFPAMWLLPPKLTQTEGRSEGTKKYEINLKIIHEGGNYDPGKKDRIWAAMEDDVSNLCLELYSSPHIISIKDTELSPQELSLTNRGELSMSVKFVLKMAFRYKNTSGLLKSHPIHRTTALSTGG